MNSIVELSVGWRRFFRVLCLGLTCVSTHSSLHAQVAVGRPIENFISPPRLFPSEGALRAAYAPLPAFDRISGKVMGEIRADLSPCPPLQGETACGIPIRWYLNMRDGRRLALDTAEVSYEQAALVSYTRAVLKGGWAWSNVEFQGGNFWVRTKIEDVTGFEKLAYAIHDFEVWCSRPGECAPVSKDMQKELNRMMAGQFQLSSCGNQTYAIHGLVKQGGRRYYKVSRTEVEEGTAQPKLPMTGYIPTRRKNGTHVGMFWSRGC